MVSCLFDGNVFWASKAPLLMIAVAKMTRANGSPHRLAYVDPGLAVENLCLQAAALDLYVHQMGGFSTDSARELFEIPADHEAAVMLAVGHLGDPDELPEPARERELMPRERRPLSEFVFEEKWGNVVGVG
jgi:nitroreductase